METGVPTQGPNSVQWQWEHERAGPGILNKGQAACSNTLKCALTATGNTPPWDISDRNNISKLGPKTWPRFLGCQLFYCNFNSVDQYSNNRFQNLDGCILYQDIEWNVLRCNHTWQVRVRPVFRNSIVKCAHLIWISDRYFVVLNL